MVNTGMELPMFYQTSKHHFIIGMNKVQDKIVKLMQQACDVWA